MVPSCFVPFMWKISIRKWNDICQTWHHVCEIPGIDKEISSTFVASLEVSVGDCPWDLETCIVIMPMFVCDVVDLCVMFSLICMSSGKKCVGWWLFCGGGVFGYCRWTKHRLPNWKNFTLELFQRVRSGSVVLWTKCEKRSFEPWLLRVVCRHIPTGVGCL